MSTCPDEYESSTSDEVPTDNKTGEEEQRQEQQKQQTEQQEQQQEQEQQQHQHQHNAQQPTTNNDQNDHDDDEDHDERQCPVCLTIVETLVCGSCRHSTCVECMEQILNANGDYNNAPWPPQSKNDIHLSAPTLGRCPICRRELSLFDIVVDASLSPSSTTATTATVTATETALYPKDVEYYLAVDGVAAALKAAVYIPYHGKIGQLSFHWNWNDLFEDIHSKQDRPFLNLTLPLEKDPERWRLEDGTLAPRLKYFEPGSHFHVASRTFHGTVRWGAGSRLNGSREWDVVLGFPADFRFLSTGRIHMRRDWPILLDGGNHNQINNNHHNHNNNDHNNEDSRLPSHYTTEQRQLCRFPFDGRWTVSWTTTATGKDKRIELHVKNNEYKQGGWPFYLNFEDSEHPTIQWPRSEHTQTVQEGVNLRREPMGPAVGAKIRWTTTSTHFPELYWERQTIGPVPIPHVILFGMGPDKQLYQRLDANTDDDGKSVIPKHHGETVWGNVFCKRLYVGSASYHFLSPTNSFLSYRHPACRDLPGMDDGSPLPTRVDFHNVVFDPDERKFTATVEWEADFGTSWNENVRWKLSMWFDTEYMVILKGGIQCEWCSEQRARSRPPRQLNPHRPAPVAVYVPPKEDEEEEEEEEEKEEQTPEEKEEEKEPDRNEEWVMSGYGHDQLYINAAMLERYRDSSAATVEFRQIGHAQCKRLHGEGATNRHLGFVKHVFDLAAQNPSSSPIDFLA